jgi:hypothetical protein
MGLAQVAQRDRGKIGLGPSVRVLSLGRDRQRAKSLNFSETECPNWFSQRLSSERRALSLKVFPRLRLMARLAQGLDVGLYVLTTTGKRDHVVNVNATGQRPQSAACTRTLASTVDRSTHTGSSIVATRYCLTPLGMGRT